MYATFNFFKTASWLTYLHINFTYLVPILWSWTDNKLSPYVAATGKGFFFSQKCHVITIILIHDLNLGSPSLTPSIDLPAAHFWQGLSLSSYLYVAKPLQSPRSRHVRNLQQSTPLCHPLPVHSVTQSQHPSATAQEAVATTEHQPRGPNEYSLILCWPWFSGDLSLAEEDGNLTPLGPSCGHLSKDCHLHISVLVINAIQVAKGLNLYHHLIHYQANHFAVVYLNNVA